MGSYNLKNILEEETQGEKSRYQLRQGNEGNIQQRGCQYRGIYYTENKFWWAQWKSLGKRNRKKLSQGVKTLSDMVMNIQEELEGQSS